MKPEKCVGIISYGGYVPIYRVKTSEIARMWGRDGEPMQAEEVAVASMDEDSVTMAVEAARYALKSAKIDPKEIGAIYIGSESKPYAVKSSGTIVAEAIGASPHITAADFEFACKGGTEALQACIGLVAAGMVKYGLAIGVDAAQAAPSDDLEYTVACGGAAFLVGPKTDETIAYFEGSCSYVSDTPDFWRRAEQPYPSHAGRFTGEPAYFRHVINAAKNLMKEFSYKPEDFDYVIFHQPNLKFPVRAGLMLGFTRKQLEPGLVIPSIGNVYAGSALLGLVAVLDSAKPGERILLVSYGSGGGSDAFSIVVQRKPSKGNPTPFISQLISRKKYLDYAQYAKYRGKMFF
ncbi:hydroxymethylglutaryl-CoA synthase [Candidatus Bathyarchaeota archaeon]|nr:MAG: hydroxymethylglutaryl-CoA synthase [Candidatus Bathyarchaeota archaeon]